MRDVAKEAYDKIKVGEIGWMRPDVSKGEMLEGFQQVAVAANSMRRDGLIRILSVHKESMSGSDLIDAIQFEKIR
jgi:hypothetical protein